MRSVHSRSNCGEPWQLIQVKERACTALQSMQITYIVTVCGISVWEIFLILSNLTWVPWAMWSSWTNWQISPPCLITVRLYQLADLWNLTTCDWLAQSPSPCPWEVSMGLPITVAWKLKHTTVFCPCICSLYIYISYISYTSYIYIYIYNIALCLPSLSGEPDELAWGTQEKKHTSASHDTF